MNPIRRMWLMGGLTRGLTGSLTGGMAGWADSARADGVMRGRPLVFPRDHGAHLQSRTEWWYATGWLGTRDKPTHGFQITFFRSLTGLAQDNGSRFAARHLLFAHAALTALAPADGGPRHVHDQRIVRWSADPAAALGSGSVSGGDVRIMRWSMRDSGAAWQARIAADDFDIDLGMARRQPLLLQGDAGYSRKGPEERQASHYYSEPQLAVSGHVQLKGGKAVEASVGAAWMDHEWSDEILHPQAVGWDWIGINLFDGSALTAFVLRRADGSPLWAGGSWRSAGQATVSFRPAEVRFVPGPTWSSPASGARYPVQWQVQTPAGSHTVRALMEAQELDGRGSTGALYWEGLSELLDAQGQRVGLGYLEMTGYAGRLQLG